MYHAHHALYACCVRYQQMTDEQFAALPNPAALELSNMFAYFREFPYFDHLRPIDQRIAAGPSYKEWAEARREQLLANFEE